MSLNLLPADLTAAAALLVALGHLVADLTGATDAVKRRRAARKRAAGQGGGGPRPTAQ